MIKVPGYTVVDRVGTGGMGVVYRAVHQKLGRQVAVKVLKDNLRKDLKRRRRFLNEARVMARLNHPNVVQLYDYMEIDQFMVLIMEYVPGTSLDVMVRETTGPIPCEQAIVIFEQTLDGLMHVHGKSVLHRDIKPSNILIRKDGGVKISDMGIAKVEGQKTLTSVGSKLGSIYYMAPELVKGGDHSLASDIYALGMTFYETLSGKIPLNEESSALDLMNSIIEMKIADPRDFYPHIPDWIVKIVLKMLSKKPEDRYQSCSEVAEAICDGQLQERLNMTERTEHEETDTCEEEHTSLSWWNRFLSRLPFGGNSGSRGTDG